VTHIKRQKLISSTLVHGYNTHIHAVPRPTTKLIIAGLYITNDGP